MKRVLGLDPLTCKRCATPMVILAFISNIDVVRKILDHLNIPVEVLPAPLAHGPWPSQTTLDVLAPEPEPEPEGDRAACSSASGARAQLQPSLGQARGPPRRYARHRRQSETFTGPVPCSTTGQVSSPDTPISDSPAQCALFDVDHDVHTVQPPAHTCR